MSTCSTKSAGERHRLGTIAIPIVAAIGLLVGGRTSQAEEATANPPETEAACCPESPPCDSPSCQACQSGRHGGSHGKVENPHHRAGYPDRIAWYAKPSCNPRYVGYYIGGSTPLRKHGRPRFPCEGTWGWDYMGGLLKRRVVLNWWKVPHAHHAAGSYETEGPKFIEHE